MNFHDTNKWYIRWFFWSAGIWITFKDRDYEIERLKEKGTNLCFFIRTMIVSAPLVILLHLLVYGTAVAAVTYWPVRLFGAVGYFSALFVGGIVTLVVLWRKKSHERKRNLEELRQRELFFHPEQTPIEVVALPASPSFRSVVWEWILAQKKKVCPVVTFSQEAQQ